MVGPSIGAQDFSGAKRDSRREVMAGSGKLTLAQLLTYTESFTNLLTVTLPILDTTRPPIFIVARASLITTVEYSSEDKHDLTRAQLSMRNLTSNY